MSYFDEEYDYDTLANDADYIDDYDDEHEDYHDDGVEAWENYYHNIADEITDDQPSLSDAIRWDVYSYLYHFFLVCSNQTIAHYEYSTTTAG